MEHVPYNPVLTTDAMLSVLLCLSLTLLVPFPTLGKQDFTEDGADQPGTDQRRLRSPPPLAGSPSCRIMA